MTLVDNYRAMVRDNTGMPPRLYTLCVERLGDHQRKRHIGSFSAWIADSSSRGNSRLSPASWLFIP